MSEHVDHELPAVIGISDQPLSLGIHYEVQQLERNISDKHRTGTCHFRDVNGALPSVDREPHWAIDVERRRSGRRPSNSF